MNSKQEFLEKLRSTFRVEAEEHLHAIATGLLELEKSPGTDEERRIVEAVFRAAHSLKGAARAVDLSEVESLCQSIEDVFAGWKRSEARPTRDAFDTVHRTLDAIAAAMGGREGSFGTVME